MPTQLDHLIEKTGARTQGPHDPTLRGECPICGRRRYVQIDVHEDGIALARCISGRCTAAEITSALGLSEGRDFAFVPDEDDDEDFRLSHDRPVAGKIAATSWSPADLVAVLAGDYVAEEPCLLRRSDGVALLYAGKVHALYGESESGKSWVALLAVLEALADGDRVLFLDFESDAATVVGRLRALGAKDDAIRERLVYVRPGEGLIEGSDALRDFETLLEEPAALAVIDGTTDALMLLGLDGNVASEVADYLRRFPARIAEETGAAVVQIDHVVKSNGGGGRFALGSQHKVSGLSGAAYIVEPVEPLAPGKRGVLTVRVAKDRPGAVRARSGAWRKGDRTAEAARVVLDSSGEGTSGALLPPETIDPTTGEDLGWKPTVLMGRIHDYLVSFGPCSWTRVKDGVSGKHEAKRQGLDALVAEGFVQESPGRQAGSSLYSVADPAAFWEMALETAREPELSEVPARADSDAAEHAEAGRAGTQPEPSETPIHAGNRAGTEPELSRNSESSDSLDHPETSRNPLPLPIAGESSDSGPSQREDNPLRAAYSDVAPSPAALAAYQAYRYEAEIGA
jgi:hypothetical protein